MFPLNKSDSENAENVRQRSKTGSLMQDKQSTSFHVTLTERDWEAGVRGWRCPVLKVPGAKVIDVFVEGNRARASRYEVICESNIVRWELSKVPEEVTVVIELTKELSPKDLTVRWKQIGIIAPIVAALIGGICGIIATSSFGPNRPSPIPTCNDKVKISVPVSQQPVSMYEDIKGTYRDLPEGHKIWVMVYPPSAERYYPQSEVELGHNKWASTKAIIGLNDEAGMPFYIHAVIADEKASASLSLYAQSAKETNVSAGIPKLPEGALPCDVVVVRRK